MKRKCNASTLLGIIAIVISLSAFSICIRFSCISDVSAVSNIIAVLTALVTVLVGFQIYNVIELEKRFDKVYERTKDELRSAGISIAGIALADFGTAECIRGDWQLASKILLNSLAYIYQGGIETPETINVASAASLNLFRIICESQKKLQYKGILFPIIDSSRAKYVLSIKKFASNDI